MLIKDGGLGIRRAASFALPAFLASVAGTLQLQDHILASLTSVMTLWQSH